MDERAESQDARFQRLHDEFNERLLNAAAEFGARFEGAGDVVPALQIPARRTEDDEPDELPSTVGSGLPANPPPPIIATQDAFVVCINGVLVTRTFHMAD